MRTVVAASYGGCMRGSVHPRRDAEGGQAYPGVAPLRMVEETRVWHPLGHWKAALHDQHYQDRDAQLLAAPHAPRRRRGSTSHALLRALHIDGSSLPSVETQNPPPSSPRTRGHCGITRRRRRPRRVNPLNHPRGADADTMPHVRCGPATPTQPTPNPKFGVQGKDQMWTRGDIGTKC